MYLPERSERTWLKLLFTLRGSPLARIKFRLLAVFLLAVSLTWAHETGLFQLHLTAVPFSLIGLALGVFLGFRNNTSYDRFWEGRKLWGRMVNTSRTFARQTLSFLPGSTVEQRQQIYRQIAYVHAFRQHLRDEVSPDCLEPWLSAEERGELKGKLNVPNTILLQISRRFTQLSVDGKLSDYRLVELERTLVELSNIQGGCERIKSTPIPHSYTILIHRIVAVYVFALPFGLADTLHELTPVVVLMVAYTFLGLDAVGDEIEDPFGYDMNDLPLNALSTMIEINLRQSLAEEEVPSMPQPDQGVLL